MLAGRFRGKRAVMLKQLASGLLLVTGPHKVKAVKSDAISDKTFARDKAKKDDTFGAKAATKELSAERKKAQADTDAGLVAALKKQPMLSKYLKARFSLTSGMKPHEMAF